MIICFTHNNNVGWEGVTSSLLSRKPAPWSLLQLGRMGKNFIYLSFCTLSVLETGYRRFTYQ